MPDQEKSVVYQELDEELQQTIKEKLSVSDDDRKFTVLLSIFGFLNEVESKPIQDHKDWVKSISEILELDPKLHPVMADNQYPAYTELLSDFIRSHTHLEKPAVQTDPTNSQGITSNYSPKKGPTYTKADDKSLHPGKKPFWAAVLGKILGNKPIG